MSRRDFLKAAAVVSAAAVAGGLGAPGVFAQAQQKAPTSATKKPIRILMGGYGPATTGFSLAMKRMGDRLEAKFGDEVDVKYVYNILDLGYRGDDILWLVEDGVLTLGYQSSSYFTERAPDLGVADLPFLFEDVQKARAAMDGRLGQVLTQRLEAGFNYRILGYFENGFRHVSNKLRPIRTPADMKGMKIRVLPSKIQERTFQLLGAEPKIMDLSEAIEGVKNGTLDAQENPFFNTVTYGVHNFHKFHTATNHFYLSRPIFLHRASFDAWPRAIQEEMRAAVQDAIVFQRDLHVKEEEEAMATIRKAGSEIIELTPQQHALFAQAVNPIFGEARAQYSRELLGLVGV
jgi:tripartite ATP-independent transporter DctP family solute receptor